MIFNSTCSTNPQVVLQPTFVQMGFGNLPEGVDRWLEASGLGRINPL